MTGAYFSVAVICISPPICNTTARKKNDPYLPWKFVRLLLIRNVN